jgi:hypothetical protein
MKPFEKLLEDNISLRQALDVYFELRQHFQELGFSESQLDDPPSYTFKMMNLFDKFQNKMNYLLSYVKDYGFEITREELNDYIKPLLMKINEVTPLKDGSNERDNTGD